MLPSSPARPSENGAIAFGLFLIRVSSCSWTSATVPASVTSTPPLRALSCATKKLRVPEPACGIFGSIAALLDPPTSFHVSAVPS